VNTCRFCGVFIDKGNECFECQLDAQITYARPRNGEILTRMADYEHLTRLAKREQELKKHKAEL
jgi:hypothetical protein